MEQHDSGTMTMQILFNISYTRFPVKEYCIFKQDKTYEDFIQVVPDWQKHFVYIGDNFYNLRFYPQSRIHVISYVISTPHQQATEFAFFWHMIDKSFSNRYIRYINCVS